MRRHARKSGYIGNLETIGCCDTRIEYTLRRTFATDLAAGATITASHTRDDGREFSADNILDGNPDTCWTTDDGQETAELELTLPEERTFDVVMLQEQIRVGQRVESFALDIWTSENWQEIASATVVGYKRLLRFTPVTASRLRLRILASRLCPTLSRVGLFKSP